MINNLDRDGGLQDEKCFNESVHILERDWLYPFLMILALGICGGIAIGDYIGYHKAIRDNEKIWTDTLNKAIKDRLDKCRVDCSCSPINSPH